MRYSRKVVNTLLLVLLGIFLAGSLAVEAAGDKPFKGQSLVLLYFEATYANAARKVVPEFEELTGAKVTLVTAPYASLYEKEFTALVTGAGGFDVMQVASQWDGQFAPYFEPLDKRLKADSNAIKIDDFVVGVARATGIWRGVRFGIPNACDAYGIIYRTDIFKNAGIKADPGWSWDDYMSIAKKLTKGGMQGTSIAGAKEQLDAFWTARYWSMGGHLMSRDWKTPLPQRDIAVKAIDMIIALKPYMPQGVLSYNIPDENAAFNHGLVAMAELWPSLIRGEASDPTKSKVVGKWSIIPYPNASPQLSSWSLAIPKSAKAKDLAWEWIKFYTAEKKQRAFLEELGIGPTRRAIYQDPNVIKKHQDFPNMLISLNGVRPRFRIAQSQEAFDFLDDRLNDALTGTMTSKQAIESIAQQWKQIISDNPPEGEYTDDYIPPFDK
ncbi:MAG: extracellular solute-binding protein [Firmicutes bacterium]|nr:extracellular solute-binding protein [Bacillota bacterium]